MDAIALDQDARDKPAEIAVMRTNLSIADTGTVRLGDAEISTTFLPLCRPNHVITDPGTLRLGDAEVSAQLPCL